MEKELRTIVYVEDEPDIRTVATLALKTLGGLEVSLCCSGAEALEMIPLLQPDIILMDVMMPGMDGPTTLRALRRMDTCRHLPVIFMTARVQPEDISTYLREGAIGVIAKPFDPLTLADDVKSHYKLWCNRVG